jgi:hypothetical protein
VVYPQVIPLLFKLMAPHATRSYSTAQERDDVSLLHMSILQDMKVCSVSEENRISILIQPRWYEWFFDLMSAYQPTPNTPLPAAAAASTAAANTTKAADSKVDVKEVKDTKDVKDKDSKDSKAAPPAAAGAGASGDGYRVSASDRGVVYSFAATLLEELMYHSLEARDGWRVLESALCALAEYAAVQPTLRSPTTNPAPTTPAANTTAAPGASALVKKPSSGDGRPPPLAVPKPSMTGGSGASPTAGGPARPPSPAPVPSPKPQLAAGASAGAVAPAGITRAPSPLGTSSAAAAGADSKAPPVARKPTTTTTSAAAAPAPSQAAAASSPTLPVLFVLHSLLNKFSLQLTKAAERRRRGARAQAVLQTVTTNLGCALDVAHDFLMAWVSDTSHEALTAAACPLAFGG